ncbi:hypothetical protein SUDANB121_00329 [Nocardiopsis dassonvillei]|uniref:hypothetical protein n=1 Tax=Nocardiopsis dassonvillei TaxID=2014 RepID=UPI003F570526
MDTVAVETLVLGVVVLLAAAVVVARVAAAVPERRRGERLAAWARERGWSHDRERPELVDRFQGHPFVAGRSNARARHVLCSRMGGHRVMAYEYSYTSSHRDGRSEATTGHVHTVVAVALPGPVPVLQVRARDTGEPGAAGAREVRAGDAAFDERFHVAAAGEDFARRVLDGRVRSLLLESGAPVPLRFGGAHLVSWQEGELDPEWAAGRARALVDLLERVPAGVWGDRRDTVG